MDKIQDIAIDPVIPTLHFQCNVALCRGACCTMPGGRGAPVSDDELGEIQAAFPVVRKYLSQEHLRVIEERGFVEGRAGDLVTTCVDGAACVFVTYEGEIARCSFEKAFLAGEINWRKPLSCHLFPIRIDRGVMEQVRFEHLQHCTPAIEGGTNAGIPVAEFVGDALIRAYGVSWYRRFLDYCRSQRKADPSGG